MKKHNFLVVAGLISGLLSVGALAGCAAQSKVATINPGTGVGNIRLGMTLAQVIKVLGTPRVKEKIDTGICYYYSSAGLLIFAGGATNYEDLNAPVTRISCGTGFKDDATWARNFWGKTREGISIGATPEQVLKAYGPPEAGADLQDYNPRTDEGNLIYLNRGILFHFLQGKLVRLTIFPLGGTEATTQPTTAPSGPIVQ